MRLAPRMKRRSPTTVILRPADLRRGRVQLAGMVEATAVVGGGGATAVHAGASTVPPDSRVGKEQTGGKTIVTSLCAVDESSGGAARGGRGAVCAGMGGHRTAAGYQCDAGRRIRPRCAAMTQTAAMFYLEHIPLALQHRLTVIQALDPNPELNNTALPLPAGRCRPRRRM